MSKSRQLRLNDPTAISNRLQEFLGKKISLVLRDERSIVGTLIDIQGNYVSVQNMRNKPMRYSVGEISELYFDTLDQC